MIVDSRPRKRGNRPVEQTKGHKLIKRFHQRIATINTNLMNGKISQWKADQLKEKAAAEFNVVIPPRYKIAIQI